MTDETDAEFDRTTSRLIRREALRRAALELSTATPAGLEDALAKISAEVTEEAAAKVQSPASPAAGVPPGAVRPRVPRPSRP